MRFYGKAEDVATRLIEAFERGGVPAALAQTFIRRKDDVPCRSWSICNQMLVAMRGEHDARGFRQWQAVGRQVKKGEKAFHILAPIVKKMEKTDDAGERSTESRIIGFKAVAVFGRSQTDGDALPEADEDALQWIESLPLIDVARSWGLKVETYNGRPNAALGKYRLGQSIALGVENLATWAHELVHAADDRLGNLNERGQHWRSEAVAELGGAVVLCCLGHERDADVGGAWQYISRYAESAGKQPINVCLSVMRRTAEAVALILDTAEQVNAEVPQQHAGRAPTDRRRRNAGRLNGRRRGNTYIGAMRAVPTTAVLALRRKAEER